MDKTFDPELEAGGWGFTNFIKYETLLQPRKVSNCISSNIRNSRALQGLVKGDKIIVEARVNVKNLKFIRYSYFRYSYFLKTKVQNK